MTIAKTAWDCNIRSNLKDIKKDLSDDRQEISDLVLTRQASSTSADSLQSGDADGCNQDRYETLESERFKGSFMSWYAGLRSVEPQIMDISGDARAAEPQHTVVFTIRRERAPFKRSSLFEEGELWSGKRSFR